MGLTLEQLVATKTKEQIRDELLLAMRGVGFVEKTGAGEGSLALSGTALLALTVRVKITVAGSVGSAAFQYSLNGGSTYNGVDIIIPSAGSYVVPTTGVTLLFANGPGLAADSFLVGDVYGFVLSIPTLPTTSWHAGSVPRTIIETDAAANEDLHRTVQNLAKGGYLLSAEDSWLDLVLEQQYDLERERGQAARHTLVLTDNGAGPHTIVAGQLVASTTAGLRFSNIAGGTLAQNGTLSLVFEAEQRGTAYNAAPDTITVLVTSLPGVSVTNPAGFGGGIVGFDGTSLVQQGVDRETNADARARAQLRWPALGLGAPEAIYELAARGASSNVTKVLVDIDPDVAGNTSVLVAGPAGPVDGPTLALVQAAVDAIAPLGTVPTAENAPSQAIAIEATVYVYAGYATTAAADIDQNLTALFQGGVNSIGEELPGLPISDGTVVLYYTDVVEQFQVVKGVRNVVLFDPVTNVSVFTGSNPILSPAADITIEEV